MAVNVLDPYFLTEIVRNYRVDPRMFRGAQILTGGTDLKTELGLTIEYDITWDDTGMTPPTGLNDPSPVRAKQKVDHLSFTNQEWREKKIIDREKIAKLRAPGTNLEQMWAEQYMTDAMVELNQRLETRLEWLRWQALTGSITIPATADKPAVTIDYKVPASQKPTAATLWSNTASANPLTDIDAWKLLFRGTGARPVKIVANQKGDTYLKQNAAIQNLVRNLYGRDVVMSDNLGMVIQQQLDGLSYEVYDGGYLDDAGNFNPFIPDNAILIVGEGTTGNLMDLVTSPSNYTDIFNGETGKWALTKIHDKGDPPTAEIVNGVTALPRLRHVNWHVFATIA
ncbi:major capsid protein [Alicyclobacillus dauci]|uniref:Major capsid protein n=1 Tax=Alicyclobacillus dauci TaxID=1475485 RepID=A0ABY6YX14_9BACL|nr:major capsid protein [Alicyclobacillus dauci]WAH35042.1 major capsid protein [Alicyclobacillus dauci]